MDTSRENVIVRMTTDFSVKIIAFQVGVRKSGMISMAGQLFRSATSIGANVREAQNAESKKDFVHKMKIAAKEADETEYWLTLCEEAPLLPDPGKLRSDIIGIHKVLTKIVATTKRNMQQSSKPARTLTNEPIRTLTN
jgi:four helix bundle protein